MTVIILLALAAGLVAALGYFAPQIRDAWYFAPQRRRAELAVHQIAQRERALHRRTGRFDVFTPAAAHDHLRALGVRDLPSAAFFFDAAPTPGKGLRLRALPRADQVLALHEGAQIYVAELAPSGRVLKQGWVP